MEQAAFEQLLNSFQTQVQTTHPLQEFTVTAGQPDKPIVIVVHGIGGNARHWSDPAGVSVNETWLFNTEANPPHQNGQFLIYSPTYQPNQIRSWTQLLTQNNLSVVNFSQSNSQDRLELAVDELKAILDGLEKIVYAAFTSAGETNPPPLIILGHSRGGLVTRAALKQLQAEASVPVQLKKVITLCTPHQGSYMPKLSNDYNYIINNKIDFSQLGRVLPAPLVALMHSSIDKLLNDVAGKVSDALKHSFGAMPTGVGFDELIPGSPMLTDLAQNEQALAGVQYYGFGGNKPVITSLFMSIAGQVVHLMGVAGGFLMGELGKIPEVHSNYGGLAELSQGDSSVALSSSVWPAQFSAPQQNFPINHMQALIYQPLQDAVISIIRS